jgi:DNA-binding CsgD family transcriptional regulator
MAIIGSTEDSKTSFLDRQRYSSLTKHDLCDLLDVVNRCLNIRADAELKDLLLHIKNIIPCANIIAVLGRMDPSGRFQDLIKIINASYPVDWATLYMERGYGAVDPILQSHFKQFKTQVWSETYRQATTPHEKEFRGQAKEFGLSQGVSTGVSSPRHNAGSLFSFAGESMGEHSRHAVMLENLVPHLHLALMRVAFSHAAKTAVLSVREREVLEWMKEGKTNWEISHILSISERTVKFHVQNILAKLQASTRGHAIALAMEQRLIGL